jgi:hypothetical protein
MFARVPRVASEVAVGDEYVTDTFTATILRVTPKKLDVLEVEFVFNLNLGDPSVIMLFWDGKRYQRWRPTDEWQLLNSTVSAYSF